MAKRARAIALTWATMLGCNTVTTNAIDDTAGTEGTSTDGAMGDPQTCQASAEALCGCISCDERTSAALVQACIDTGDAALSCWLEQSQLGASCQDGIEACGTFGLTDESAVRCTDAAAAYCVCESCTDAGRGVVYNTCVRQASADILCWADQINPDGETIDCDSARAACYGESSTPVVGDPEVCMIGVSAFCTCRDCPDAQATFDQCVAEGEGSLACWANEVDDRGQITCETAEVECEGADPPDPPEPPDPTDMARTTEVPLDNGEAINTESTNLGNLVADAILLLGLESHSDLDAPEPALALVNRGAIQYDGVIPAGPLPDEVIDEMLMFDNTLVIVHDVSAADLRASIEVGLETIDEPFNGSFAQVAGLEIAYDRTFAVGERVRTLRVLSTDPTLDVVVDGVLQVIDPLSLVTPEFTAMGNVGWPLESYTRTVLPRSERDTVKWYIDEYLEATVPEPLYPEGGSGRIVDITGDCTLQAWHPDVDEDGFGGPDRVMMACEATGEFVTLDASDCCDIDADAFPGQDRGGTTPNECGDFDYNCINGVERMLDTCGPPPCPPGGSYWASCPAPDCGELAYFIPGSQTCGLSSTGFNMTQTCI